MKRLTRTLVIALLASACFVSPQTLTAQEHGMKHEAGVPSRTLTLTGLHDEKRTLSPEDLEAMPHVSVTVVNGHSHQTETYSGVPVKDLLVLVTAKPDAGEKPISPRNTIVVAGATDHFQVTLTLCDTDPGCRSGEAIVADAESGKPLSEDGAFKLILTEDKTPGRWARNLDSLTEKKIDAM